MFRTLLPRAALLCLTVLASAAASADNLEAAAMDMCEKVKACSLAQIEQSDMTPEMREMMEPMLDTMCEGMQAKVEDVAAGHPLHQPAVACMRSMEALSCDDMRNPDSMQTTECETYEKMAREYADAQ